MSSIIFVSAAITNSTNDSLGNNLSSNLSNESLFQNSQTSTVTPQVVLSQQKLVAQNESINTSSKKHILTKVFSEDNLDFDREYKEKYLDENKNFSNLEFKKVIALEKSILTVGAKNNKVRGFEINVNNFAVDLLYCNSYERYCTFRINGVPTKKLFSVKDFGDSKTNSFDLDIDYKIKIESIEFDFCDNRRFCHLGFEGYNIVNVSIERK